MADVEYGYPTYQPYHEPDEAPHIGHCKHLCDIANRGAGDLESFKALVRNPRFICKRCGRAAAKEENLCEPVTL